MHSQENVPKPQIWPVSLSQNESFMGHVLLVGMYTVSFFIIIWKYVLPGEALPPIAIWGRAALQGQFWKASFPKIGCDFIKFT